MDFPFTDRSRLSLRAICKAPFAGYDRVIDSRMSSEPAGHLENRTDDSVKTTPTNQDSATWTNATDGSDAHRNFLTERTTTFSRTVSRSFRDCTAASLTRALHTAHPQVCRRRFRRNNELIAVSRERENPMGVLESMGRVKILSESCHTTTTLWRIMTATMDQDWKSDARR
jgi:hypothetical protein